MQIEPRQPVVPLRDIMREEEEVARAIRATTTRSTASALQERWADRPSGKTALGISC